MQTIKERIIRINFTATDEEYIIKKYKLGSTVRSLAAEFNTNELYIGYLLKKRGFRIHGWVEEQREAAIERIKNPRSCHLHQNGRHGASCRGNSSRQESLVRNPARHDSCDEDYK